LKLNEIRIPVPKVLLFPLLTLPINTKLLFICCFFIALQLIPIRNIAFRIPQIILNRINHSFIFLYLQKGYQ